MKVLDLEGLSYFWTKIKNKFYIKPDTGIPKSDLSSEVQGSLNKADTALQTETDPIFTASPAHGISSEDIIYWDNKQEKLSAVKIIGSMYRTNVSGSGSISIQGNVGQFPVVLEAGTYTVVTDMQSNTNSYGLSVNCGGNTYTLNTTDGHIHDSREITIPANGRWSGTVIGSVAGNSIISVKIEKVADEVTEIALVGITNDYNDLDNKPILTNYFDGAVYDSNTKRINFKNGNVVKAYIDATAFIKDGMVDNVEIEDGKLIITFNTESGKEPIKLDITAIFDPSNYYDKSTIDNFLDDKANVTDLATVATSGEYSDLINPPTNVSDFTNDAGYLTEHQDISGKANISDLDDVAFSGDYSDLSNVPTNVSSFTNDAGYLTEHQSLSNYYTKSETDNLLDDKADTSDLATVATSGDYNDLTNKPTIPSAQVNSDWNATSGVAQILNKPDIPSVSQVDNTGTSIIVGSTSYNIVTTNSPSGNANTYIAPSWSAMDNVCGKLDFRTHVDDTSIGVNTDDELYVKSLSADKLTNGTNNKVFTASEQTKLAGIAAGAEVNVQSDWNETNTSSDAFIKNKPTIPDAQIQSDWNQTNTSAKDYIKNKPNLTNNNGSLDIKPYNWYTGDINIETSLDAGDININSGDHLNLYADDGNINLSTNGSSIKLNSYTVYKDKEIAVKDDIPTNIVNDINGFSGSVSTVESKLVTTSVPNITSVGSASTWNFSMGTGNDIHTLIITGNNSTTPTLGTSITVATGSLSLSGQGGYVITGINSSVGISD